MGRVILHVKESKGAGIHEPCPGDVAKVTLHVTGVLPLHILAKIGLNI